MKCKFYSAYTSNHYGNGLCHYEEEMFNGLPQLCTHMDDDFENCICFKPCGEEAVSVQSTTNEEELTHPRTLTIQNCDEIILKPKGLGVEVKIEKYNFDDFNYIEINGHKFERV